MEIKMYKRYQGDAKAVREEVFVNEQGFSYDYDEYDDIAAHFVMYDEDVPVAVCRVYLKDEPGTFMFGRLAVKKSYRKKGLGSKMIEAAKEYVCRLGGKVLILHSQLHARDFYKKLGFEESGEIEYEDGRPHIWMKIRV